MTYNRPMALLSSKLTPPSIDGTLDRERLVTPLTCPPGNRPPARLIQIVAGAGFGKTTLAAQLAAQGQCVPIWYRLDEFDGDFSLFMAYLTQALTRALPQSPFEFPPPPGPTLEEAQRLSWLIDWLAALDSGLDQPVQFILDDLHRLDGRLNAVLEFILERLPANAAMILISRREPGLKISRLRAGLGVTDIREHQLSFTPGETRRFFQILGQETDDVEMIQTKTQGWAAGIALVSSALAQIPLNAAALDQLPDSRDDIFAYLEENIFEHQSAGDRKFMVKTALLSFMEPDFCNKVLEIRDSLERFQRMAGRHLMVFPLTGKETGYYYHQLLQDFLLARAPEILGKKEIRRIHKKAADILAQDGHPLALHHYIEASAYDQANALLSDLETQVLLMGQMPFIKECLEKVPTPVRDRHPQLLFMAAKQHSYYGDPLQAIDFLNQARELFLAQGHPQAADKCLADLGAQYYYIGQIPRARQLLEAVLADTSIQSHTFILVMTYLIFLTAVQGNMAASRAYEQRARNGVADYPPFMKDTAHILIDTSVTYREYISGDLQASTRRNRSLVSRIQRIDLPACMPLARYQSAATDFMQGRYEDGITHAREGIKAASKIHLRDSQKGWIYLAWAENNMGLKQWDKARKNAHHGLEIFQGQNNAWGQSHSHNTLARIHFHQKELPQALEQVDTGLACLEDRDLEFQAAIIGLTRARILMARREPERALPLLKDLIPTLEPAPHYQTLAQHLIRECQKPGAQAPRANPAAEDAGWAPWFKERLQGLPRPQEGLPPLNIRLLGPFQLSVGERTIAPDQWTHGKSLLLFKYLAAHQEQGYLPKDLLLEILWPGEDPAKTGKRFNVAVSRLRKILEPDLPSKAASHYIQRNRDQYRLVSGEAVSSDVQAFLHHARQCQTQNPDQARDHARKAVALYRGPFLEDTRYQDWCAPRREELAREYASLLRRLIQESREADQPEESCHWIQAYLAHDPFEESLYAPLMTLFADQGRYDQVQHWFSQCEQRMAELDCPISPELRQCYQTLMTRRPKD